MASNLDNWNCCGSRYNKIDQYLKHLKKHKLNKSLLIKCNLCGFNSISWNSFKKHYTFWHKESEIFDFISNNDDICFDQQELEENLGDRKIENIFALKRFIF